MAKISIMDCLKELDVKESSVDVLKEINGGCTFKVGRCLADGNGYIIKIYSQCGNHSSHTSKAIAWAKSNLSKGASAKIKVTNSSIKIV